MGAGAQEGIKQLRALIDQVDERLRSTFQNIHQGYLDETLLRFLKAREWNVSKAHKMLVDCLNWRIENEIDNILSRSLKYHGDPVGLYYLCSLLPVFNHLACVHVGKINVHCMLSSMDMKPIVPTDLYRAVRDSQRIGLSGYSKEGLPVLAIGVGLSTYDKASVHYYVQSHLQINEYRDRIVLPATSKKHGHYIGTCLKVLDMTGLKISALGQIKLLTIISTVDDLNYPEKTDTYYIVNAPYIFSACWKVVKPLLQERTQRKVQVLQGCGRDELLNVMDYSSLPHFCRKEGSRSSRHSHPPTDDCFSLDHHFHQQLYSYVKEQSLIEQPVAPISQGSFHVDVPEPDPEGSKIVQTIESELHKIGNQNGVSRSMNGLTITSD